MNSRSLPRNVFSSLFLGLLLLGFECYCFVIYIIQKKKELAVSNSKPVLNETSSYLQHKKENKKFLLYMSCGHAWDRDQDSVKAGKWGIPFIKQMSFTDADMSLHLH